MRGIQPLPSCPERVKAKEKYHAHGPHAEWKKNPQNSQKNERMGSFKNLIKVSCQNPPAHARHIFLIKKDLLDF
jgi:hypothetical protein|tara:strand:- start:71 stop:292 length:222 start_codon:yes stop_codon:yes gene_type:complete